MSTTTKQYWLALGYLLCIGLIILMINYQYATANTLFQVATPSITPVLIPDTAYHAAVDATPPAAEGALEWVNGLSDSMIVAETITSTQTITPTILPTATPIPPQFLPLVILDPTETAVPYQPPVNTLICDSLGSPLSIPDRDISGVSNMIVISDPRKIADLNVFVDIEHPWVGDIKVQLAHLDSGKLITLIDRPGRPATSLGCASADINGILDDEISSPVENKCESEPAAISGIYLPDDPLSNFDGESLNGSWSLVVLDNHLSKVGALKHWCIAAQVSDTYQPTTPAPTFPSLPAEKKISGVTGQGQKLNLDCESRSAVDWANYFNYKIDELKFFNQLPNSDNPDTGFVGNVNGAWGQIPPRPYGVHAEPVAQLLREYGVPAYAHRPLSWDALRAEIASGRPVITWIIGAIENGIPVFYTPSDGLTTIVARYEHTVVVTGYSESHVFYLNGASIYSRPIEQFLDSWSALDNMAIIAEP